MRIRIRAASIAFLCVAGLVSCKTPTPSDLDTATIDPTAVADTRGEPRQYAYQIVESWEKELDHGPAEGVLLSRVTMTLHPGGKARVEDKGKKKVSYVDVVNGKEHETTEWHNVWKGNWSEESRGTAIDLVREKRECEMKRVSPEVGEEVDLECPSKKDTARLMCELKMIEDGRYLIDPEEATEPWPEAWVCWVTGGTYHTMEGTPLHWVFGEDACYQVSSTSGKTQNFCLCTGFEL